MVESAHPQKRKLGVNGEDMQRRRSEPDIEWDDHRGSFENTPIVSLTMKREINFNIFFFLMKEEVNHQFIVL